MWMGNVPSRMWEGTQPQLQFILHQSHSHLGIHHYVLNAFSNTLRCTTVLPAGQAASVLPDGITSLRCLPYDIFFSSWSGVLFMGTRFLRFRKLTSLILNPHTNEHGRESTHEQKRKKERKKTLSFIIQKHIYY